MRGVNSLWAMNVPAMRNYARLVGVDVADAERAMFAQISEMAPGFPEEIERAVETFCAPILAE